MNPRSKKEPGIITLDGTPVAVIPPIKEHEALLERLEDGEDVANFKKARTKSHSFRPLAAHLADRHKTHV